MALDDLKKLYSEREQEPQQAPEYWKPENKDGL